MLKILNINKNIISQATNFLPKDYIKTLKNKSNFNESIVARFLIFKNHNFLPIIDINQKPIFENDFFWSISHKENLVFVWSSNIPIWIDIEIIKKRSLEIFSLHLKKEYIFFWEKNLKNFYLLWVLKESVIKLNLITLDDLEYINIQSIIKKNIIIDWIKFMFQAYWIYKNTEFISFIWYKNNLVYAISHFK